ncbi:hypothetical protein E0198_004464 [Clavispora lusitaniae]|nr:hypothetical protein E0198_004464 [Clavispora lusitaniae]
MRFLRTYSKSALGERFQQILEEQISSSSASAIRRDPLLSQQDGSKLSQDAVDSPPNTTKTTSEDADNAFRAAKNEDKAQEARYARQFQKEIAYVASEPLLRTKASKQLADTISQKPWDGQERLIDTAARMLDDSTRKLPGAGQSQKIITPPVPWPDRVRNAREQSLDYRVGKSEATKSEQDEFREMYRERLLGPSMFINSASPTATLGLVGTLADARINAAIDQRTGKFSSEDMESVRGKPLDRERLANSNDTTFFINEILTKQECLPPWIESQQGTQRAVETFRRDLQKKWFTLLLDGLGGHKEALVKVRRPNFDGKTTFSSFRGRFEKAHGHYIATKVAALNREIRNYNLQCPSPSLHKWKLVESNEVWKSFEQVIERIEPLIEEYARPKIVERKPERTGMWKQVKSLFS